MTKPAMVAAGALACLLTGCTPGRVLDQFNDPEPQTMTLAWYEQLVAWHRTIREVELHGGILDI